MTERRSISGESTSQPPLISVHDLSVSFRIAKGRVDAVRQVSFSIAPGEIVALVGESGSGKSTIGQALMGLLRYDDKAEVAGSALFRSREDGEVDLVKISDRAMRRLRGNELAMIFQEPMSSLNPLFTVGGQITEQIRAHRDVSRREARTQALALLEQLGFPNPAKTLTSYPHQLSGGMRQRAMIGMALSCDPALLIADEPTTALDVTIQAQIIDLLKRLQARTQMAILFITHDLGLVAEIANRALVMHNGQVVEQGSVLDIFKQPKMPYTRSLLAAVPRLGASRCKAAVDEAGTEPAPIPAQAR
ncbi:ABC transporter ATP-binding protein [Rhodoligotrophos defluvii]|uniref:ABC transporter ATP-binding protein n=1 Tax=Rhodoligotrophos defluvii TaxID=2561934 RepID=UPI00196170D7|nr:ABC transporter ATP-binding protein [Rhodoligotrophos defluvii]